jgi:Flp pilus assembly protein TadD
MRIRFLFLHLVVTCLISSLICLAGTTATAQDKPAKVSDGELKASAAVESAVDANARMLAAEAFVKKYPKSSLRKKVFDRITDQVYDENDATKRLALAQKAVTIFTTDSEVATFKPAIVDAFIKLERLDEAFNEGVAVLTKNPDDIQILVNLAIAGVEQAKKGNGKFVPQSKQYGLKAIEQIEADKKPAEMEDAAWTKFKATLPQLYQETGIISLMQQDSADAQARLEKARTLNPADPFNYVLLANIVNNEYQTVAQTFQKMFDGKAKEDMRVKVTQLMDKVIDLYAHAIALSEGKPGYERLHEQTLKDMTPYYMYRHNNSTEGMQKLIDSYKLP